MSSQAHTAAGPTSNNVNITSTIAIILNFPSRYEEQIGQLDKSDVQFALPRLQKKVRDALDLNPPADKADALRALHTTIEKALVARRQQVLQPSAV